MAAEKRNIRAVSKKKLREADASSVREYLSDLKTYFPDNKWIGTNNRYRRFPVGAIKRDTVGLSPAGNPVFVNNLNDKHLSEYLTASSIIHCCDGWSYFGKALNAIANLDVDIARHLAYYAELRAAISILATEGIGIFDKKHVIIKPDKKVDVITREFGTHEMTWKALEHWASLKKSTSSLLGTITPDSHNLNNWLDTYGIDTYKDTVGNRWLKNWGADLKSFTTDREARNHLSYRPTHINGFNEIDLDELTVILDEIWTLSNYPTFQGLDKYLLKQSLITGFELKNGRKAEDNRADYEMSINSLVRDLAPTGNSEDRWKSFLKEDLNGIPKILEYASMKDNVLHDKHYLQVLGRAFVLLRIASGMVQRNTEEADIGKEDLEFWWKEMGVNLGYWTELDDFDDVQDLLYVEVHEALTDMLNWKSSLGAAITPKDWRDQRYFQKDVLAETQRILLSALIA